MNDLKHGILLNLTRVLCDNDNEAHTPLPTLHVIGRGKHVQSRAPV